MSEQHNVNTDASSSRHNLLLELQQHVLEAGRVKFANHDLYQFAARGALTKAFEFSIFCSQEQNHPFFLMASLRGICEDLITLSFLKTVPERSEIITLITAKNGAEARYSQSVFFESSHPHQPVLSAKQADVQNAQKNIKEFAKKMGWGNAMPKVRRMAELCSPSLVPLYDYLYAATSSLVHFNPHILLRMAWGAAPNPEDLLASQVQWEFSTSNFSSYYLEFTRFHSSYLLLQICRTLIDEFSNASSVLKILDTLDRELQNELRWPEVATFEEYNLKGPSYIERILLLSLQERGKKQDS